MKQSILKDKSKLFALRVIRLYKYLCEEKKEYVLSKQLLRSGTSIGANIAEAFYGQSEADFVAKLSISQKETSETIYWLELLHESEYLKDNEFDSVYSDAEELIKLLTSSIKTIKEKMLQSKLSNVQKITSAENLRSRASDEIVPFREFIIKDDTSALL